VNYFLSNCRCLLLFAGNFNSPHTIVSCREREGGRFHFYLKTAKTVSNMAKNLFLVAEDWKFQAFKCC
jgi:hypothetical protein